MRRWAVGLQILTMSCNPFAPCKEDRQVIEAVYGGGFYQLQLNAVAEWRKLGYNCTSVAIRNAFGTPIGDTYTCTKCQ